MSDERRRLVCMPVGLSPEPNVPSVIQQCSTCGSDVWRSIASLDVIDPPECVVCMFTNDDDDEISVVVPQQILDQLVGSGDFVDEASVLVVANALADFARAARAIRRQEAGDS